ncbi:MAG: cation-translocating P-type ATPase [Lachnospiraceae bacterium]|jgi:Ca2+-transporting ATPase|nr:cation-translocating P-type ATPase [Lachnospiraceae bacterium]
MLTNQQAKINQEKYGPNELVEEKRKSLFGIFLEQFKDFLVIILIIAAIVAGALGDVESTIVILIVITINAILGTVQTIKAQQSLDSLKKLSAPEAKVIRDGVTMLIPAREVTIGDEVLVEAGDSIVADGKLLSVAGLKVDESALTGESVPVEKSMDPVSESAALGDRTDSVFSGSFATYGRGTYEVIGIAMETEVGKIATLLKTAQNKLTPLQISLNDFGKKLGIGILILCSIIFGLNVLQGGKILDAFLFAVALAVAAIPEALSSIVTIVLSFGTQRMAEEGAIIRKLQAVEGLGSVSIICSDKTGTLTQNKMTVEHYYIDGKDIPVDKIDLKVPNEKLLLHFSMLNNDSTNKDGKEIGDPTETALINLATNLGISVDNVRDDYKRFAEIPFDSDRKLMSTAHPYGGRYIMIVKGAVDVLLDRITRIRIGDSDREFNEDDKAKIISQNLEYSRNGLRVLAFAYKHVGEEADIAFEDENELTFVGLIAMMDPPREESRAAVMECKMAGIRPIMITGDHKITAAAIAKRIGILEDESEAVEGSVIEDMTDDELKEFVPKISVYARVSPEHKIRIVRAWQELGNVVSMTGDGVNDAPALKQADIGVAMGITGTEVSKDASSMVLTDDNFATIVKAVENGRNVYQNIKFAIQFLLSGNFAGILVILYASLLSLPVPFAPVHLLFINLLTDSLPAIALGLEPPTSEVMKDKPRPRNEGILTRIFLTRIGTEGFVIACMTAIAYMIGLGEGDHTLAMTMAFAVLCTSRLVHGFNCKSNRPVIFTRKFFNNKFLIGAFLLGLVLITSVVTVPALQGVFKVESLDLAHLGIVYGLALANLPVIQGMKAIFKFNKK